MRDYQYEVEKRVSFIKNILKDANSNGIVFGNSGGKDSALVGILAKMASGNVLGVIMPCESHQNYNSDKDDAILLANQFNIQTLIVDITKTKIELCRAMGNIVEYRSQASNNIAPRIRMTTLYAIGQSKNYLVAGTGNKSERYMGYFTKWGDGACDFNPISDLTASEIFEFLRYLNAPSTILTKRPSAGLFDGQTDEDEMGVSYKELDSYLNNDGVSTSSLEVIKLAHEKTNHKRKLPILFGD